MRAVRRGALDGIDLSTQSTRTVNVAARIYDEIDRREAARKGCAVNISAICEAIGISRSGVEHNPVLKAIIERHRTAIPDDAAVQRYIGRLERENAALRAWHEDSVKSELMAEEVRKKYLILEDENTLLKNKVQIRNNEVLELRAERDSLRKQVNELNSLVANGAFGSTGIGAADDES